jgi:hypothetical protein
MYSGLFAGTVMMLALMLAETSLGQGFWTPLQLIGGTLLGLNAVLGGFWAGLVGAVLHLAAAGFWGVAFAALVSRETTVRQAFWSGLGYSVAVWAIMTYIGLPVLDRTMEPRVALIPGAWFLSHLVFGACLLWTPTLRRIFSVEPERAWDAIGEREFRIERGTPVGVTAASK